MKTRRVWIFVAFLNSQYTILHPRDPYIPLVKLICVLWLLSLSIIGRIRGTIRLVNQWCIECWPVVWYFLILNSVALVPTRRSSCYCLAGRNIKDIYTVLCSEQLQSQKSRTWSTRGAWSSNCYSLITSTWKHVWFEIYHCEIRYLPCLFLRPTWMLGWRWFRVGCWRFPSKSRFYERYHQGKED